MFLSPNKNAEKLAAAQQEEKKKQLSEKLKQLTNEIVALAKEKDAQVCYLYDACQNIIATIDGQIRHNGYSMQVNELLKDIK